MMIYRRMIWKRSQYNKVGNALYVGKFYHLGLGNVLAVVMGDSTRQAIGLILKPNGQIGMPLKSIKEQENRSGDRRMIWE